MTRGRHGTKRRSRVLLIVAIAAGIVVLGVGGGAYAALRYERAHAGRIMPGVRIGDVDVSNMTRDDAIAAVQAEADAALSVDLSVDAGNQHYHVTPASLGKRAEVSAAVDQALAAGADLGTFGRAWHRLRQEPLDVQIDLSYRVGGGGVRSLVHQIANDIEREPRDAALTANDALTDVRRISARPGAALPADRAMTALRSALDAGSDNVNLHVRSIAPKVTADSLGMTIVVRIDQNRLYLYRGVKVIKSYPVASAKPGYTTPAGVWTIWDKRVDPTWYNPALDSWGAGLPAVVPGGPGNPMGPRAIYIDAPGLIRIHGTSDESSIGRYASHGCIRMHNADVIDLFDRIQIGDHVIVLGVRPANATYWSVPPASDI